MNRMSKQKIRRYAVAVVMLIIAGYISVFIKDTIDSKNPEISLPVISVTTGYTSIPIPDVPRAGYEWNFATKSVQSPFVSCIDVPLIAYEALPDAPILVRFSIPHKSITLYEGKGAAPENFVEKRYDMNTSSEEGVYVYKVVAQFDRGTIVHYFALNVTQPNTLA